MLSQQLDGLAYDGLVELPLGVDGIPPKAKRTQSDAGNGKIANIFKGPMYDLQHIMITKVSTIKS